jgi:uncharacterized protein (TIGR03000 family)
MGGMMAPATGDGTRRARYYDPQSGMWYEMAPPTTGSTTEERGRQGDRQPERTPAPRPGGGGDQVLGPAPATLIVHLPADARLSVDGEPTRSTSDTRVLVSPPLQPGKTYHYVLEAQLDRGGEKVKTSQNVEVRAGRRAEVYLEFPARGVVLR